MAKFQTVQVVNFKATNEDIDESYSCGIKNIKVHNISRIRLMDQKKQVDVFGYILMCGEPHQNTEHERPMRLICIRDASGIVWVEIPSKIVDEEPHRFYQNEMILLNNLVVSEEDDKIILIYSIWTSYHFPRTIEVTYMI